MLTPNLQTPRSAGGKLGPGPRVRARWTPRQGRRGRRITRLLIFAVLLPTLFFGVIFAIVLVFVPQLWWTIPQALRQLADERWLGRILTTGRCHLLTAPVVQLGLPQPEQDSALLRPLGATLGISPDAWEAATHDGIPGYNYLWVDIHFLATCPHDYCLQLFHTPPHAGFQARLFWHTLGATPALREVQPLAGAEFATHAGHCTGWAMRTALPSEAPLVYRARILAVLPKGLSSVRGSFGVDIFRLSAPDGVSRVASASGTSLGGGGGSGGGSGGGGGEGSRFSPSGDAVPARGAGADIDGGGNFGPGSGGGPIAGSLCCARRGKGLARPPCPKLFLPYVAAAPGRRRPCWDVPAAWPPERWALPAGGVTLVASTAVSLGAADPRRPRLALAADSQYGSLVFRQLVAQLADQAPDAVILAGDVVENSRYLDKWLRHFHWPLGKLFVRRDGHSGPGPRLPGLLVSPGNHDLEGQYEHFHALLGPPVGKPANRTWAGSDPNGSWPDPFNLGYPTPGGLFQSGGLLSPWLSVSSLNSFDGSLHQEQLLVRALRAPAARRAACRLVIMHTPPWVEFWEPVAWHRKKEYAPSDHARKRWVDLFNSLGVDLVVSGHSHLYQRSHMAPFVVKNGPGDSQLVASTYVTIGGGGGHLDLEPHTPSLSSDRTAKDHWARSEFHFSQVFARTIHNRHFYALAEVRPEPVPGSEGPKLGGDWYIHWEVFSFGQDRTLDLASIPCRGPLDGP